MKRNSFHKERIVIEGNHDRDTQDGLDFMSEYDGVARVLRNEVIGVAGGKLSVAGVTWSACQEENFIEAMNNIQSWGGQEKKKIDLLLTHLGPRVKGGGRGWEVGSRVLSQFVKDVSPALHCFGHIHYARGVRKDSDVTMVNSASANMMVPIVIDYCPDRKRALMIHCPMSDESMEDHFASVKFPTEWLVEAD
jgi:Icc-related predicted phosphoesterase